jgi:hypothetical protein
MPLNFAEPFGQIGGAAGGAGGGILGGLAHLLEPLDYVRQAAWNLIKKPIDAITEGDASHLLGMIPGVAGLAGTLVGGPWGGAAAAGLGQAIGKMAAPEQFEAPKVSDLTGTEDFLPNLLVGALTDPLTYAGGFGGHAFGKKAGQEFGTGLENAARLKFPGYGATAEDVMGAFEPGMVERWRNSPQVYTSGERVGHPTYAGLGVKHLDEILANPEALREFVPGSKYGAHGAEAMMFKRPEAGATTFGRNELKIPGTFDPVTGTPYTRPDIPEVIQAARSVGIGPHRIEQLPFMDVPKFNNINMTRAEALAEDLLGKNIGFWDVKPGNIGYAPGNKPYVLDPGAIWPTRVVDRPADVSLGAQPWKTDIPIPRAPELPGEAPGKLKSWLLDMLGSDAKVRQEIEEGVRQYRGGKPIPPMPPGFEKPGYQTAAEEFKTLTPTNKIGLPSATEPTFTIPTGGEAAAASPVRASELEQARELLRKELGLPPSAGTPSPSLSADLARQELMDQAKRDWAGFGQGTPPPSPNVAGSPSPWSPSPSPGMTPSPGYGAGPGGLPSPELSSGLRGSSEIPLSPPPPSPSASWLAGDIRNMRAGPPTPLPPTAAPGIQSAIAETEFRLAQAKAAGRPATEIAFLQNELASLQAKLPPALPPMPTPPVPGTEPGIAMLDQILREVMAGRQVNRPTPPIPPTTPLIG